MHKRHTTIDTKAPKHLHTITTVFHHDSQDSHLPELYKITKSSANLTEKGNLKLSHVKSPSEDIKRKHKDFLELMGLGERSPVSNLHSPLVSTKATPKISITDLMGSKKLLFFKQSGFLPMYYECKRVQDFQKIVDKKKALSHANIVHTDQIRANSILYESNQSNASKKEVNFKRLRNRKKTTKKVAQIEEIYRQCDVLSLEMKQAKMRIDLPFIKANY